MWIIIQDAKKIEFLAKFNALWTKPYIIKEIFDNNLIQLKTLDGKDFSIQISGSRCKKYKVH